MFFRDLIVYTSLVIYVLYITRINNMWGVSKGTKKAKVDVKLEKETLKKRARLIKRLSFFTWISDNLGFAFPEHKELDFTYKISRLHLNLKLLDRPIKAKELNGFLKLIQLTSLAITLLLFGLTFSIFSFILLIGAIAPVIFSTYARLMIHDEDQELEEDFPDLYILLYSKLVQGTKIRLTPTLNDYLLSLDATKNNPGKKNHKIIRQFVSDLRNNIELFGDDSIAVAKLRDKYTSVMVINFCNLATQALKGVDNRDKLLSFKMELMDQQKEMMEKRADKMVTKGKRAIWVIYAILFQFILLSWFAKLTQADGLKGILPF